MKKAMKKVLLLACLGASLPACQDVKPKDVTKPTQSLGDAYGSTAVTAKSAVVISTSKVVAVTTIAKGHGGAVDPAREDFRLGLYVKMKQYCSPCHAGQNSFPFASPGLDLAYATAKKYVTVDSAASRIIQQINAGHNGAQPAWATEFAPLVTSMAQKLPPP